MGSEIIKIKFNGGKYFMKKATSILLIIFICLFSVAGCKPKDGNLYSVQEAYELGYLTNDDLLDIAEKYNKRFETANNENNLLPNIEQKIKNCYLLDLKKLQPLATVNEINIVYYYGDFNDCVLVEVTDTLIAYDLIFETKQIGEAVFYNYNSRKIRAWTLKGD